jgi:cyclopropane fatty-acyl-phospholipid synthase-like methyltransferase
MSQQEFWNEKFSRNGYLYGTKPNEFLASKKDLLKANSKLLCLGEGEGRNAIFFAKNGFEVTAMDASDIGISKLHFRTLEEGVRIETICIDLNDWIVSEKFDAIVTSYLHMYKNERETLFKKIEESLNKGGYFIGEFFSTKQIDYNSGGPKDLDLLYTTEDFEKHFSSCSKTISEEIVTLDEGKGHKGEACVIRVVIKKN